MDPWLSEKDVDKILRELGPGSMRPSPLVPAERYTSRDWLLCLLTLPTALEFRRVFSQLLANTIFAVMVWAGYIMYPQTVGFLTAGLHPGAHLLLGGALGLLLVFRTNTAYDRFWEARRLWGFLISRMRELARLGHSSLRGLDREHFLQLTAAFMPILLQHLQSGWKGWSRENVQLKEESDRQLSLLVPKGDLELLLPSNNRPFLLMKMLGNILAMVYSDPEKVRAQRWQQAGEPSEMDSAVITAALTAERWHGEQMIMGAVEAVGGCERIVKTSVPESYSRHTSRFLSVWCFTLPLVLVESLHWRIIPLVAVISWALYTIEEVGRLIEDPFNMVWSGADELKLNDSFAGTRLDVMERLPAKERSLLDQKGDTTIARDYDVTKFHADYIRTVSGNAAAAAPPTAAT